MQITQEGKIEGFDIEAKKLHNIESERDNDVN
jgi:hypothetical protein